MQIIDSTDLMKNLIDEPLLRKPIISGILQAFLGKARVLEHAIPREQVRLPEPLGAFRADVEMRLTTFARFEVMKRGVDEDRVIYSVMRLCPRWNAKALIGAKPERGAVDPFDFGIFGFIEGDGVICVNVGDWLEYLTLSVC